ncbi:MAG: PrsW family glutamic-type intramembrane protease [Gemmataceae bacterium]
MDKAFPPPMEEKTASKKTPPPTKAKNPLPIIDDGPDSRDDIRLPSIDDLLALLPDNRIEGAYLPRKTAVHWLYALLAAGLFLAFTFVLFPDGGEALHLLLLAVFTATIGILLLLLAQVLANWTQGRILVGRNIIVMLLFWLAWAIGFSYRAALDPTIGFVPSFFGYTFGVGFCEEVCKALPILFHYRMKGALARTTVCAWGFVSGVGFGVSEGIMYSADFYNGIASGDIYLVRFVSCVALHGIWTASAALFIHKHRQIIQAQFHWIEYIPRALFLVAIPMVLHGLYDTFLKKEMNGLALVTALVSFGWFAWSIEQARAGEATAKGALGKA